MSFLGIENSAILQYCSTMPTEVYRVPTECCAESCANCTVSPLLRQRKDCSSVSKVFRLVYVDMRNSHLQLGSELSYRITHLSSSASRCWGRCCRFYSGRTTSTYCEIERYQA